MFYDFLTLKNILRNIADKNKGYKANSYYFKKVY